MKIPSREGRSCQPSPYSRFVIFTGAAVATGLLAAAAAITYYAPFANTTFHYVAMVRMGKSCIESALASLASMLCAAAIGEAALNRK